MITEWFFFFQEWFLAVIGPIILIGVAATILVSVFVAIIIIARIATNDEGV